MVEELRSTPPQAVAVVAAYAGGGEALQRLAAAIRELLLGQDVESA